MHFWFIFEATERYRGTMCRCCWLVARYQPRHCSHVTSINNCRWCMSWSLLCFVLMIWQENIPPQIISNLSLSQGSPSAIQSHVDQHPWNICSDRICLFYTVFLSVLGQQLLPLLLHRILLHFGHNFKMYSLAWESLRGRQRRKRVRRRRDRVQNRDSGCPTSPSASPRHVWALCSPEVRWTARWGLQIQRGARLHKSSAPADSHSRIAPSGCLLQAVITHRLAVVWGWGMSYNITHNKACHIKNGVK